MKPNKMKKTMNEAVELAKGDYSVLDATLADAMRNSEEKRLAAAEVVNRKVEMPNDEREAHKDIKNAEMKKMYLSESLFTDFVEEELNEGVENLSLTTDKEIINLNVQEKEEINVTEPITEKLWQDSQYDDEEDKAWAEEQVKEYFKDVEYGYGWVTIDKAVEDLNGQGILVNEEDVVQYVNENNYNIMTFVDIPVVLTPTAPSREEIAKDLGVEYDHIDEVLEEDFSTSFPNWLKRRDIKELLRRRGIDLANAEFVPDVIPASARSGNLQDSTKLSCFYIKPPRWGGNVVWIKGLNDDEYVDLGDGYRAIKYYSMKRVLDNAAEYGYIDLTNPQNRTSGIQQNRKARQNGVVDRRKTAQYQREFRKWDRETGQELPPELQWITQKGYDKSGYKIDPDKYKNKLEDVGYDNYQERLDKYHDRIEKLRERLLKLLTGYNTKTGMRYESSWNDDFADAAKYFTRCVEEYAKIIKEIDKILSRDWKDESEKEYYFKDIFTGRGWTASVKTLRKELEQAEAFMSKVEKAIADEQAKVEEPVEEPVEETDVVEEGLMDRVKAVAKKVFKKEQPRKELEKRYGLYDRVGHLRYGPYDNEVLAELELKDITRFSDKLFNELQVKELTPDDYKKYIKEDVSAGDVDHYEILDWLSEHEQANEDAKSFFAAKGLELYDVAVDDLIDWIAEHEQLFKDFQDEFKDRLLVENKLTEATSDAVTLKLLDMIDEGVLNARAVALACLKYMGEGDVAMMAKLNGFIDDEELEESLKEDWEDENPNSVRLLQMVDDKLIAADSLAQDIIHYLADDNKVGEFCRQSEYFWDMNESVEEDTVAIQHYEVDILDTLHFLSDSYLEGRVAAGPYARGLRKAYNALEEIEVEPKPVDEGCENKQLNEYKRPEGAVLKYKKKREPLADIIQQELTDGEWGYVESPDGKLSPTNMPSANYLPDHVGIDWDKNDNCVVVVWGSSEAELQKAVEIAKKYNKEYKLGFDKYVAGDKKHYIHIYLDEDKDFDEPYFNPNDPVVDTTKKSKKVDDDFDDDDYMDESFNGDVKDVILEEVDDVTEITLIPEGQEDVVVEEPTVKTESAERLDEVMISTEGLRNFKPWDGAVSTYNAVLENGKLDTLEFMLEDMYPNGIGASELNDLLWFQKDWVLEMLGIGVEPEDYSEVEVTGEVPEEK